MNGEFLSDMVITRVRSASAVYTPKNTRASRKDRPRWAAIIKYEGETVYTANGKQLLSDANHPVLLPKGCSYEWQCTKAGHFFTVEFECDKSFYEPIGFFVKSSEKILKLFKDLEYKRNLKNPLTEMESIRDTYSILLALLDSESEKYVPKDKKQRLLPAIEYISQNCCEGITNDKLAALLGVSTVYFRKMFFEVMGVSPIVYARRLRIEKAKEMLKSDYGTLSDLAQSLGYTSLYDFSRDFKKHTGFAPSKY